MYLQIPGEYLCTLSKNKTKKIILITHLVYIITGTYFFKQKARSPPSRKAFDPPLEKSTQPDKRFAANYADSMRRGWRRVEGETVPLNG